jgi:hypothetical protein
LGAQAFSLSPKTAPAMAPRYFRISRANPHSCAVFPSLPAPP